MESPLNLHCCEFQVGSCYALTHPDLQGLHSGSCSLLFLTLLRTPGWIPSQRMDDLISSPMKRLPYCMRNGAMGLGPTVRPLRKGLGPNLERRL